jgi:hypothetical protein
MRDNAVQMNKKMSSPITAGKPFNLLANTFYLPHRSVYTE